MKRDGLTYWVALSSIEGIGAAVFKTLLQAFGTPERIFSASAAELKAVPGIASKTASRIREFEGWQKCQEEIVRMQSAGMRILCLEDSSYPYMLRNIFDCPSVLYVKGNLPSDEIRIAVVGSRRASAYGRYATQKLCRELAQKGVVVVSGLARGIDTAAHEGALSGRGRTIAVLGCGIDIVYPPENRKLHAAVAESGALISEYPMGTGPHAGHFPARNRIISGLSMGVVVVEAGEKSGSLITARCALEQGREVFAVPGAIDTSGSRGTHRLIKDGAKLVEDVEDILEEILPQIRTTNPVALPSSEPEAGNRSSESEESRAAGNEENAILRLLDSGPRELDRIVAETGWNAQRVLEFLTRLEIAGQVTQLPGKRFTIKE